jgi:hypothetical protein
MFHYGIIVDEATDISMSKHVSLSTYEVKEYFIGIYEYMEGETTDALLEFIIDILMRCRLDALG